MCATISENLTSTASMSQLIANLITNGLMATFKDGRDLKTKHDSKFSGLLAFGSFESFLHGLEGLVGKPDRELLVAMKREHDSDQEFTSSNYKVKTTPRLEFQFVFDEKETAKFIETSKNASEKRVFKSLKKLREDDPSGKLALLSDLELAAIRLYTGIGHMR